MPEIILIAAVAKNRVIGRDNQLIWNIPEDMAHFKALTQGHTVLMGRKTWESLPPRFRPLPGRRNIVVSRQADYPAAGAKVVASLEAGFAQLAPQEKVFVIGGAEIYSQSLPYAGQMELTEVDLEPEGDAWFPAFAGDEWEIAECREFVSSTGTTGAFLSYRRR
jgi:dihydrofolate reductase